MTRLLFIAHRVPYPPDKGERIRAFNELKVLSKQFRVTLGTLAHTQADWDAARSLEKYCERVIVCQAGGKIGLCRSILGVLKGLSATEGFFRSPRLQRLMTVESLREPFDLIFAYSSSMLPYALSVGAKARVIDLVDVDSAKWASYAETAALPKRWLYRREAIAVRHLEGEAVRRCDAVFLVSPPEVAALDIRDEKIIAVGNGVNTEFFSPEAVEPVDLGPAALIFTGQMDYRPNVDGVNWFVREVWPGLKRQLPELSFTIVGRNPTKSVRRLSKIAGVQVTGSVPDVRPYLAGATLVICPLRIARGVQNKILEAMAMGKAVLASPGATEGLEVDIGQHLLRAESVGEWQRQILNLVKDMPTRDRLGKAARRCVQERYTWAGRMEPLVQICKNLSETAASASPDSSQSRTPDSTKGQVTGIKECTTH